MQTARTTRFFLAGLAAALGLGALADQVVPASAEPASGDHVDSADTASLPAPGTYESCTTYFGLTKSNSDLATSCDQSVTR